MRTASSWAALPAFLRLAAAISTKKYFGKFEEVYHFNGAFDGMFRHWNDRAAFWAFLATFLHTTLTAPIRAPYHDLDALLKGKDFFVITTNQDT